ncbi:MAG: hypothetical protein LBK76_03865, partial [Verrucomicrobiales bacterium]|nr:hypothetical protein [Verrucomicrobiales bacterium]
MKTVTWRKLMTVSGFLCLPLANAAAANQDWSATPSGTNDNGQYLANSGTNWSSGNAPVGNGDLWRFTGASTGVNIYNNFAADTKFALSFESGPPAYTISGNRINLSAITNNSDQTETLNLDVLMNGNLEVNGNNPAGTIAITGTLVGTANVQLKPMLSGTLSIGSIDFGSYRLQLGTTAQKGGDWTTLSNALSSVVIGNLSGAFDNFSFGKVMLTGSNHLTGQTALGNQSLTEFRYTGTADRKLTNNDLTIYNGTLLLTGGTVTEQVNRLRVSANYAYGVGDTRIVRDSGSSSIMVNSIDRNNNNYYTLNISDDNLLGAVTNVFGSAYHSGTFTGPLIAPTWLTVNASDWAVYDTETKYLRALKTAEYTAFAADLNNGDAHALLNGSAAVNNNLKANTLKLTTTTASGTLTLGAGAKLTLNSGGLLLTGAHDYTISGGIITSSYENQLLLALNLWNDSAGALDLATDLNVSYLIKSGSGALILSGSNSFPAYGTTREFTISSGTVILNHEYALNNAGLALNIGTGGLDLNDYHAVVRSVRGQSNGQFTITNSGKNIVDLVVGQRDDSDPNEGSHTFGLATAVITGNLRLVLQGNSNTSLTFVNDNTHTGGLKLIGSSTARGDYFHYRFTKAGSFGAAGAPLELGDNGGFAVWASNWDDWTTPVMISGSNTFITSQSGNRLASNGAWSGNGDVELRNLTLTLASPLDAFSGTIKFSAAGANTTNKVTTVTSPIVSGSALTTGSAATYALWRAADGGNDESTLNVTLQFKGAGAAYDVHIGDLVSFSQLTGSAAMKSGDNENSRGLVANNTENSTANLIVGSANHAYSEFAERIADSGTLDVNGAVTGVQS